MALIHSGSQCSICCQPLRGEPYVATTHFIGDPTDPLHEFSDTAMHYACFQRWEYRETFVEKYNSSVGRIIWGDGTRHRMQPDGTITTLLAEGGEIAPDR